MSRITVDEMLARARARLRRVEPRDARAAVQSGEAMLIDIRSDSQIAADGVVPGTLRLARNVLEWRLDPECPYRHPEAPDPGAQVVLMCDAGYASSLAAVSLQELGFARATDMIGGFQAWREAGLPVAPLSEAAAR